MDVDTAVKYLKKRVANPPPLRLGGSDAYDAGIRADDWDVFFELGYDCHGYLFDERTGRYFMSEEDLLAWEIAKIQERLDGVGDDIPRWDDDYDDDGRIKCYQEWLNDYDRFVYKLAERGVVTDTPPAAERFPKVAARIAALRRERAGKTASRRLTRREVNREIYTRLDPYAELRSPHVAEDGEGRLYDSRTRSYFRTMEEYLEHQRAHLAAWIESDAPLEGRDPSDPEYPGIVWRKLEGAVDEYDRIVGQLGYLGAAVDPRPAKVLFRDAALRAAETVMLPARTRGR